MNEAKYDSIAINSRTSPIALKRITFPFYPTSISHLCVLAVHRCGPAVLSMPLLLFWACDSRCAAGSRGTGRLCRILIAKSPRQAFSILCLQWLGVWLNANETFSWMRHGWTSCRALHQVRKSTCIVPGWHSKRVFLGTESYLGAVNLQCSPFNIRSFKSTFILTLHVFLWGPSSRSWARMLGQVLAGGLAGSAACFEVDFGKRT